ncbi:MAG: protein kinase [Acidobacteriota bacterium]
MTDPRSAEDLVGQRVGPYLLENRLGAGGMGWVFQAWDERLHRRVALKQIKPEVAGDARNRERFRREARAAAALNHPAIVQIHDLLEAEDGDWIVMELVEGETLTERVRVRGPLEVDALLDIGIQIAEALAEAHDQGIVHRDLKTENVVLTPAGKVKVLDFGLAKRLWSSETEASISVEGRVLGTLRTMSPEQAMGSELDGRSDLFSLGVLLYEAGTGDSPFRGNGPAQTLTRVISHDPPPPAALMPELSEELSDFILHLLAKRPEQRPASAHRVVTHLAVLRGGSAWAGRGGPAPAALGGGEATLRPASSTHLPTSPIPRSEAPPGAVAATEVAGPSASRSFVSSGPASVADPYSAPPGTGFPPGGTGAASMAPTVVPTEATVLLPPVAPASLWPRRLLWSFASLLLVAAMAAAGWWWLNQPPPAIYVAMPEVRRVGGGKEGAELVVADAVRYGALKALTALEEVYPLPPAEIDALPAALDDPSELARQTAADEVLTAELSCRRVECQLTLARVRGSDGGLLWTDSFSLPVDEVATLDRIVRGRVTRGYPQRESNDSVPALDVGAEDYERFLQLRRGLQGAGSEIAGEGLSRQQIAADVEEILSSAPDFFEARLLASEVARLRYFEGSRDQQDLDNLRRQLQLARNLAPTDPAPLHTLFTVQVQNGELEVAEQTLADLEELVPGEVRLQRHRALLLRAQGQAEEALTVMERAVERQPSWKNLMDLAVLQVRAGAVNDARSTLERLLALVPESFDALSLLAQLELTVGSVERAEALYTQLVERAPESAERANLGLTQMLLGRYPEAVESYRLLVAEAPDNVVMLINLADAYDLLGDKEQAAVVYERILEVTGEDPDSFEDRFPHAQALAHLGRSREAAESITSALADYPEDPQAAYAAALVYTLIGERTSALVHARRAMAGGFGERWFSFPWFDPLREGGELQALVTELEDGGAS